ncbi:MAG: hypothetical protein KTR14_02920 [Vampirovibrio sp.]|nr:hypothetical protein [Vampirovibrio sp.]
MVSSREVMLISAVGIAAAVFVGFTFTEPAIKDMMVKQGKVGALKDEVALLTAQKEGAEKDLERYKQKVELPEGITIRRFEPNKLEEHLKVILDNIVDIADGSGNQVMALEKQDNLVFSVPTPPSEAGKPPEEQEAPPPIELKGFQYDMTVRGTYSSLVDFIAAVSREKELVEMATIRVENEAGPNRTDAVKGQVDVGLLKPVKMDLRLKLYLRPL